MGIMKRRAFTLVELLVVIGIIVILISILVPVIGRARTAAYVTNSQSIISGISSACDRYFQDFRTYPGPIGREQVARMGNTAFPAAKVRSTELAPSGDPIVGTNPEDYITGTENLVLGLLGGLTIDSSTGDIYFDKSQVGAGPMKLGPISTSSPYKVINGKRYSPYMDKANLSDGLFSSQSGVRCGDTNIPEFVDGFGDDQMPILYLRANRAGPGVAGRYTPPATFATAQYKIDDVLAYTDAHGTPPMSIGAVFPKQHGLRHLGMLFDGTTPSADPADNNNADGAEDAIVYLSSKSGVNSPGPNATWGDADDVVTPVNKDGYVLIAAGKDRIYGTADDITNFGASR
jgi:prepilin-type N-terminal cleavage/methylation domain-containing protein